jgi:hypothetical protein
MADVQKRETLRAQGTLYTTPGNVKADLFSVHPEFFDSEDKLQVRYELLRAAAHGEMTVSQVCQGLWRQPPDLLHASALIPGAWGGRTGRRQARSQGSVEGEPRSGHLRTDHQTRATPTLWGRPRRDGSGTLWNPTPSANGRTAPAYKKTPFDLAEYRLTGSKPTRICGQPLWPGELHPMWPWLRDSHASGWPDWATSRRAGRSL